jgi:hypothetical protein
LVLWQVEMVAIPWRNRVVKTFEAELISRIFAGVDP